MNELSVQDKADEYYSELFTKNHKFSTPYPNIVEARRWAKISEYLSLISDMTNTSYESKMRILDVGCGRGWLVKLASVYGTCDGIDPVEESIRHAKHMFPDMNFYTGKLPDLICNPSFIPYNVVISTEVIEHINDKDNFVKSISSSLLPDGYAIITTPRSELFNKFSKHYELQPVEAWISEKDLSRLFKLHGFSAINNDRVYEEIPSLSFFHRLCSSKKIAKIMDTIGISSIHKAMEHIASIYQVWLFHKNC